MINIIASIIIGIGLLLLSFHLAYNYSPIGVGLWVWITGLIYIKLDLHFGITGPVYKS